MKLGDSFKEHVQCQIGDGRQFSLFYDDWLQQGTISELIGNRVSSWGMNLKVRDWWSDEGLRLPSSFSRRHPDIAAVILRVQLSNDPDVASWKPAMDGKYSIAVSYYNLYRRKGSKVNWDSIVCAPNIPPKLSFCHWLLRKEALKTRLLLARRGVSMDTNCPLCLSQVEDCGHLFFQCGYTIMVWKGILNRLGIQRNPGGWDVD